MGFTLDELEFLKHVKEGDVTKHYNQTVRWKYHNRMMERIRTALEDIHHVLYYYEGHVPGFDVAATIHVAKETLKKDSEQLDKFSPDWRNWGYVVGLDEIEKHKHTRRRRH